jgi:OOP family OmpA-OmpF porin
MKKVTLFLFFVGGLVSLQAQNMIPNDSINDINRTFTLKLGVNLVDNSGNPNPFNLFTNFDQQAFSNNYNVELEYRFSNWFSLATALSNNQWKANKGNIDSFIVNADQKYLAIDLDLKLYYDEAFTWFDRNDWAELYLHGGVGSVYQGSQTGVSLNFGPGANFWVTDRFGINVNGTAKWVLNSGDHLYNTSHFQYSASLMYRFIDNDDDNDGVKNKIDNCPNMPGFAENNGCPEPIDDRDGDGVVDAIDNCPNVYGTGLGCPKININKTTEIDTDGDSVFDSVDNCPKIKGLPTNNGCPLPDTDNDGIVDAADQCPKVPGLESNNGCPFKKVMMIGNVDSDLNTLSKKLLFSSGNYSFRQDIYPILIEIVNIMKQHPFAVFKLEGHTDSAGSFNSNRRLSQARTNAVKNYLIDSGIPKENITTEAFGETKPIASNLSKEGRRKNRRVEIIMIR